ncbi:MAG: cation transporter dimerization domain-containing protein [Desulfuromonadales bacterium]
MCKHLSVEEAHDITDYIEKKIGEHIIGTDVTIHVEPCRQHDCPGRDVCPTQKVRHAENQHEKWWHQDNEPTESQPQ